MQYQEKIIKEWCDTYHKYDKQDTSQIIFEKVEESWAKDDNNQPLKQMINTPYNLNKIQPRSTKVWNCNNHSNDNGLNARLKYISNYAKASLILKYGMVNV